MGKLQLKIKTGNNVLDNEIALSQDLIDLYKLRVGSIIDVDTKENCSIGLRVAKSFIPGIYVSYETFDKLNIIEDNSNYIDKITLGCDPEFFILNGNKLIDASLFFSKEGSVGSDGILMELRPEPSIYASIVTKNISRLIKDAKDMTQKLSPNIKLIADSCIFGNAAGFHLHYGIPEQILNNYRKYRTVANFIIQILDYYVAIPAIIPERNNYERRYSQKINYGKPGSYRIDHRTIEFRTPSGILLKHPTLTEGVLSLGAVVVNDVINRLKWYTNDFTMLHKVKIEDVRTFYPNIVPTFRIFETVCSTTVDRAIKLLPKINDDVQKMVGYKENELSINNFFAFLEKSWSTGNDMEANWRKFDVNTKEGQMVFS